MRPSHDWYEDLSRDAYVHGQTGAVLSKTAVARMSGQWFTSNQTTSVTSGTSAHLPYVSGPQYVPPPPNWATLPCGHQVKLEPGQPVPTLCEKCPAPERRHHEYKCGHIYNYLSNQLLPAECPTCASARFQEEKKREEREKEEAAERAARLAADKDPLAWLNKQLDETRAVLV